MPLACTLWYDIMHNLKLNMFWNMYLLNGGQCMFFHGMIALLRVWFFSLMLRLISPFFFFWPATRFYSFTLFFVSVHVCSENGIFNYVPLRSTLCSYALPLKSCLLWLTHFFYTWNLSDFMIAIRVLLTAKYASVCVCTGAVTVKNVLRF